MTAATCCARLWCLRHRTSRFQRKKKYLLSVVVDVFSSALAALFLAARLAITSLHILKKSLRIELTFPLNSSWTADCLIAGTNVFRITFCCHARNRSLMCDLEFVIARSLTLALNLFRLSTLLRHNFEKYLCRSSESFRSAS